MTNSASLKHASNRAMLATAVFAALLALAACSQSEHAAEGEEAHTGSSSAGLPAGHAEAGEKLANAKGKATGQSCVDCHGAEGNKPIDPTYPKLGGQYHDYIAHSLQSYRSGEREHALMSQQAKELTDQQIADLAAYFGSRPSQLKDLHGAHD